MTLADGIRKHGFRKWYERELLQGHGHLALTFISVVGVFAGFEALSRNRGGGDQAVDLLSILLCGAVALWALRRYLYLLAHAEAVAQQADCPSCGVYARFKLVQSDAAGDQVRVRCNKCAHEWVIES